MMNNSFADLVKALASRRPLKKLNGKDTFYFRDHPVCLREGVMNDVHWVDIQIELPRYRVDNLSSAQKVLQANLEMGAATPIPTWFATDESGKVIFINRLDWRHLTVEVLDGHVMRCIEQMSDALAAEGV